MVDPRGAAFVMLTPSWWLEQQTLPPDAARASLFAAMLDRRTRCPLVADVSFYRQLWAAAMVQGLATTPETNVAGYVHRFSAEGLEQAGLDPLGAITFKASHDVLEAFLAEQVGMYFEQQRAA
jgi:hypothetical protein